MLLVSIAGNLLSISHFYCPMSPFRGLHKLVVLSDLISSVSLAHVVDRDLMFEMVFCFLLGILGLEEALQYCLTA